MDALQTPPGDLLSARLLVLRDLAHSLEDSQLALARNDAERIALGAARQAELCRQWSLVEEQLRSDAAARQSDPVDASDSTAARQSASIEKEFVALTARIRHLTRVHCSLLRHLQRSLAILNHVVNRCSPTYAPAMNQRIDTQPQAGD